MPSRSKNFIKPLARLAKGAAREPFLMFFFLLAVAAIAAAALFYDSRQAGVFDAGQGVVAAKTFFDAGQVQRFREVFSIIRQRQSDYDQAASAEYPDIFQQSSGTQK